METESEKNVNPASVKTEMSQTEPEDKVQQWRYDEFTRMGFDKLVAFRLSHTRIDLHAMERLLDQGCPHDLAVHILEGTMWCGDDPLAYEDESTRVLVEA